MCIRDRWYSVTNLIRELNQGRFPTQGYRFLIKTWLSYNIGCYCSYIVAGRFPQEWSCNDKTPIYIYILFVGAFPSFVYKANCNATRKNLSMTYQKQKARFLPCFLLIIFAHTVENFFYLWEDKTIIQYERNSIIMWIADNWKDYEVIDCSKGEKLERWGDYILVRPDPQVIWDTPKTDKGLSLIHIWRCRRS